MTLSESLQMAPVGLVAIGRNEGERLRRCLRSIPDGLVRAVYVDSGSSDGSVAFARSLGVEVVELDMSIPFTAARARNEGIERLLEVAPSVAFVQVIDGDCELAPGWIESALEAMQRATDTAVVCGRRRERSPEASVYNQLCDMEWNTPVGESDSCGGDALLRLKAWQAVGGYDPTLIAGEEPEMCLRMRRAGWRILRIDREMTLHDAQMTRFEQWFRRNLRAGHAFAEGYDRHGRGAEAYYARQLASNLAWGVALPVTALSGAALSLGASMSALGGGYVWLWRRIVRQAEAQGMSASEARLYARWCVLGKLPQGLGALQYFRNRVLGRQTRLIEYKAAADSTAS